MIEAFEKDYWNNCDNPFSLIRANWTKDDFRSRTDETVLNLFDFNLLQTDVFLDLGCGLGYICKMVAPLVKNYIGIDFAPNILKTARNNNKEHKNALFIENNGKTIPLANASVDVIVSEQVFQHICEDIEHGMTVADLYFAEIARVLKPNGRVCIQLPRKEAYVHYGFEDHDIERAKRIIGECESIGFEIWYCHITRNIKKTTTHMWKTADKHNG